MYENQIELQSKIDKINGAFENLKLKGPVADKSLAYVKNCHNVQQKIYEMNRFLDALTPSLSQTIIAFLVRRITSQVDFFSLKFGGGANENTYGREAILLS